MQPGCKYDRVRTRERRAVVVWFALVALVVLTPRFLLSGWHEHLTGLERSGACAACVMSHAPAHTAPSAASLDAPVASDIAPAEAPDQQHRPDFAWASPLARGPPAAVA